jgi:hypothetical protein
MKSAIAPHSFRFIGFHPEASSMWLSYSTADSEMASPYQLVFMSVGFHWMMVENSIWTLVLLDFGYLMSFIT